MSAWARTATWIATGLLLGPAAWVQAQPLQIGGDPRVDPSAYRVTVFANSLDFPLGMAELSDGSLLVGMNRESFPGANLLNSDGELVRFVDADGDGVADGPGQVLASGLEAVTSVSIAGDLVFVATGAIGTPRIEVLLLGATPADVLTPLGSLDLTLPLPWSHLTMSLTARTLASAPGEYEVFFNLGSREDAVASTDLAAASGLWTGNLAADVLYRMHVDDTGATLTVPSIDLIATGLRNAFGQAFQPGTGDLFVQDNGMDAPHSADELNVIAAADVGGAAEDFGFPSTYVAYPSGAPVGAGGIAPFVAFLPLPGGAESQGPAEMAFAPQRFGALDGGLFVTFHGSGAGVGNTTNPLVWTDPGTGEYFHFAAAGQADVGHLDSLLATFETLYAADLTSAADIQNYGTGAIYAIRFLPACDDGSDDDGDGLVDFVGGDPGCDDPDDVSERRDPSEGAPFFPCDDGIDNDGDGRIDLDPATRADPSAIAGTGDPACWAAHVPSEVSPCQDGIDNDDDALIDFDGGASLDLDQDGFVDAQFNPAQPAITGSDPQCASPWGGKERMGCGLGFELALLMPLLMRLRRRRLH